MSDNEPDFYGLPVAIAGPETTVAQAREALEKFGESKNQYVERLAKKTDTHPTEAQKESGRYRKGRISLHGLRIAIENPKGSMRSGTSEDGKKWETKMHSHYGYIEGTEGKDTDPVDVFIGNEPDSEFVVAINQVDPKTQRFDEHKIMLGYSSVASAKKCYMKNYESGWKGLGSATAMTMDQFKWWLEEQDTKKPIKDGFFTAPENRKEKPPETFKPVRKSGPQIVARITVTSHRIISMPKLASGKCPGCGNAFKDDEPYPDVENCEVCERFGPPRKSASGWIYSCCGKEFCDGCPESSTLIKVSDDKHVPTVAVDLDGTLAKHYDKYDADSIPDPRPGAKKSMEEFQRRGYRLIIFTVRGDKKLVRDWLHEHEIPYDYINENPDQPDDASDKVLADVYIDDRGVNARSSWKRIEKQVVRRADKEAEDWEIGRSDISGKGLIATRNLDAGAYLGQAIDYIGQDPFERDILWSLDPLGRYLNYSHDHNTEIRPGSGGYDLYTSRDVKDGEEFTASWKYREEHTVMGSPQNAVLINGTKPGTDSTKEAALDLSADAQHIRTALSRWNRQRDYDGTSWDGVIDLCTAIANLTDTAAVESPGWYTYPSSTKTEEKDGKDWRYVLPAFSPPVVVNCHSLLTQDAWTLTTTVFQDPEIDVNKLDVLSGNDPYRLGLELAIATARVLQQDGYNYASAIESMVDRLVEHIEDD